MSEALVAADAAPAPGFRRGSPGRPMPPIARQPAAWRRGRARVLLPGDRIPHEPPAWLYGDFAVHRPFTGTRPTLVGWSGPAVTAAALRDAAAAHGEESALGAAAHQVAKRMARGRPFHGCVRDYATSAALAGGAALAPWRALAAELGGELSITFDDTEPARHGWTVTHLGTGLPVLSQGATFRRLADAKDAVERIDPAFADLAGDRVDAQALLRDPAFGRAAERMRAVQAHARQRDLLQRRAARAARALARARDRHAKLAAALTEHERTGVAFSLAPTALVDLAGQGPPVEEVEHRDRGAGDYVIRDPQALARGTAASKAADNLAAIAVLDLLERGQRPPDAAERNILGRFVGWGGMPGVFSDVAGATIPAETKTALRAALDPERYAAARRATQNAHYTDPRIGAAMWAALTRLGVQGGRVLEPGCGAGWLLGAMPKRLRSKTRVSGIEADPVAAGVARALYPSADIRTARLEDTPLPDGFYDAALGNVPFAATRPADVRYRALSPVMHDYFLLRSLDALKPGGAAILITSTGTLDKQDSAVREALRDRAELIEAVRLPAGTFRGAQSAVVVDLLLLRKRPQPLSALSEQACQAAIESEPDWISLGALPDPEGGEALSINAFLAADPTRILGELARTRDSFGHPTLTVRRSGGMDALASALGERLASLSPPEPAPAQAAPQPQPAAHAAAVAAPGETKEGGYFVAADGDVRINHGVAGAPAELKPRDAGMVADALALRDALRALIRAQQTGEGIGERESLRAELNTLYDSFVVAHGPLSARRNGAVLRRDPDGPLLLALEESSAAGELAKAAVFSRDTVRPLKRPERVEDAAAALTQVLDETGAVDIARMGELLGTTPAAAAAAAGGLIYPLPAGGWQTADAYLAGDVVTKLGEAEAAAALDPAFADNVAALAAVQPDEVAYSEIAIRLGSPIPTAEDYRAFVAEALELDPADLGVRRDQQTGRWYLGPASPRARQARRGVVARIELGTERLDAFQLVEKTMNGAPIVVTDKTDDGGRVFNLSATMAARARSEIWKRRFRDWIWTDADRRRRVTRDYNARFNRTQQRRYDGAHLTFPGMSREWAAMIRPRQADAVWRVLSGGNTLLAHEVGTGKTLVLAAIAQEAKRVGKASKTLIAVQRATLADFGRTYRDAYPAATLLVWPDKATVTANERREFFARAATGDWDAIIVPHDAFDLLRAAPESEARMLREICAEARAGAAIADAEAAPDTRHVKRLEATIDKLEARIRRLIDTGREDNTVYFDDLGVDQLLVDEAQRYKNLHVHTAMGHVKGLPSQASQRAAQLYSKVSQLNRQTGERGLVLATGTPISNSVAELYTLQRYLQPTALAARGIGAFDSWAGVFAEPETRVEIDVTGRYRPVTRLARYVNLPELKAMTDAVVDTVFADQVADIERPDAVAATVAVPASAAQRAYIAELGDRAAALGDVDPADDNMLKISTEGRLAALDMRLVDPEAEDDPGSKLNELVRRVARIYRDNPDATQLVFFDIGVNPTSLNPDFSLRAELVADKLVEAGIPAAEIGDFFTATGTDREALKAKLRTGEVRVALGSTEKLGTGVNVQDRVVAMHHLDAPWTPAGLAQRNGRGRRQGNQWRQVHIYPFVTQNTFDSFTWQLLDAKTRFIRQFMSTDGVGRSIRDHDADTLTPGQVMAVATGDPLALYRAELEADVNALEAARIAHGRDQLDMARAHQALTADIDAMQAARAPAKAVARQAAAALAADAVWQPAAGRAVKGRKAVANRLAAALERRREVLERDRFAAPVSAGRWREVPVEAGGTGASGPTLALVLADGRRHPLGGGAGTGDVALRRRAEEPARLAAALAERRSDRDKLAGLMGAPFADADALTLKQGELARIERIVALPAPDPEAVDALAEAHPALDYGAIAERVDALLANTGEDPAAAREAVAWHALGARRHGALAAAPTEIPMPVARRGRLITRMTPAPAAASFALAPPIAHARRAARREGDAAETPRLAALRRRRAMVAAFAAGDPTEGSAALAPAIATVALARPEPRDQVRHHYALAPVRLPLSPFAYDDSRVRQRPLIVGFDEHFVDESDFHQRCAVINSWASAELAQIAPFVQVQATGHVVEAGAEPPVTRRDAAYTPEVAADGTVAQRIFLDVYAGEMEESLAHETFHALYRTGRFTPVEWRRLTDPRLLAIWRERFGIDEFYAATPGRCDEEAVAARFAAAWSEAAAAGGGAHLRLQEPEETDPAIVDAAAAAEQVFGAIAEGTPGRRPRNPAAVRWTLLELGHDVTGARFALGGARLHFDRGGFKPVELVVDDPAQLLNLARDRYLLEHGVDAAARASVEHFARALDDDTVRASEHYARERGAHRIVVDLRSGPASDPAEIDARAMDVARYVLAAELLENDEAAYWEVMRRADDVALEAFLGGATPMALAVADSHGHGYVIVTDDDHDSYVPLDPYGELCSYGDGSWEDAVANARRDAAHYGAARRPHNLPAALAGWLPRRVRAADIFEGLQPALARGDFAIVRHGDGFGLLHLGAGGLVTDPAGVPLAAPRAAELTTLAEALQTRFAWRALTSRTDLAALLTGQTAHAERTAEVRRMTADFAAGRREWEPAAGAKLSFRTPTPGRGDRSQAQFAVMRLRLHFERGDMVPWHDAVSNEQTLGVAREWYGEGLFEDTMGALLPEVEAGLDEDQIRASEHYHKAWDALRYGPDKDAAARDAAALAEARDALAVELCNESDTFDDELFERADVIALEAFDRYCEGLVPMAVVDTNGHGYLIATFNDHKDYVAVDPSGELCGGGGWEEAVAAARSDAAAYARFKALNKRAGTRAWGRRQVRVMGHGQQPALARGDFAIVRRGDGYGLLHLGAGGLVTDPAGVPLAAERTAELTTFAEALQTRFAWRSIASAKDLSAILSGDGPERATEVRRMTADFAAGRREWEPPAGEKLSFRPVPRRTGQQVQFAVGEAPDESLKRQLTPLMDTSQPLNRPAGRRRWVPRRIKLATTDHGIVVVDAMTRGDWAVHETLASRDRGEVPVWQVSHLPTGCTIPGLQSKDRKIAIAIAEALQRAYTWSSLTVDVHEVRRHTRRWQGELTPVINEMREAVREGRFEEWAAEQRRRAPAFKRAERADAEGTRYALGRTPLQETHAKEFVNILNGLARNHSRRQVFEDFCELAYCAIAKTAATDPEAAEALEARYMATIGRYDKDQAPAFPELLGLTAAAAGSGDFLGQIYLDMGLDDRRRGQVFTPWDVAKMMAGITLGNAEDAFADKPVVTVAEPACGAGVMVLAFADAVAASGRDPGAQVWFDATDVDKVCQQMTYIQLSLAGLAGVVRHGDSIALTQRDAAVTPRGLQLLQENDAARDLILPGDKPPPDVPLQQATIDFPDDKPPPDVPLQQATIDFPDDTADRKYALAPATDRTSQARERGREGAHDEETGMADKGFDIDSDDVVAGDAIEFREEVRAGGWRNPQRLGERLVRGRVLRDSYGERRQQHTFMIEVERSTGADALEPGAVIRRRAGNLYRHGTRRAPWSDENARKEALAETHARGDRAGLERGREDEDMSGARYSLAPAHDRSALEVPGRAWAARLVDRVVESGGTVATAGAIVAGQLIDSAPAAAGPAVEAGVRERLYELERYGEGQLVNIQYWVDSWLRDAAAARVAENPANPLLADLATAPSPTEMLLAAAGESIATGAAEVAAGFDAQGELLAAWLGSVGGEIGRLAGITGEAAMDLMRQAGTAFEFGAQAPPLPSPLPDWFAELPGDTSTADAAVTPLPVAPEGATQLDTSAAEAAACGWVERVLDHGGIWAHKAAVFVEAETGVNPMTAADFLSGVCYALDHDHDRVACAPGGREQLIDDLRAVVTHLNPHVDFAAVDMLDVPPGDVRALIESGAAAGSHGATVSGMYQPLENLVTVSLDRARFGASGVRETAYHEAWHSLEFVQTAAEQRLLGEKFPGDGAVRRFLKAEPKLAGRALAALGGDARRDSVAAFAAAYVGRVARGEPCDRAVARACDRMQRWLRSEIDSFEKLKPAQRWRQIERLRPGAKEIAFLGDKRALVVYGAAAETARVASATFRRARQAGDGGYRIGRGQLGAVMRELRAAGHYATVHGPEAAFYGDAVEGMSHKERAAYAFGRWAREREAHAPEVTSIFTKVLNHLERFANVLYGRGLQRPEDVFERAWAGRMAERFGPAAARHADAAVAGLAANRARVTPEQAERLGRAFSTAEPDPDPEAGYQPGALVALARSSVLRPAAAAAAERHYTTRLVAPERRAAVIEGQTTLNVIAALSALADNRELPFPLPGLDAARLAHEIDTYSAFREHVMARERAATGAIAGRVLSSTSPARSPRSGRRFAHAAVTPGRVPPGVMREAAERMVALLRDQAEPAPSFSLALTGAAPIAMAADLYGALEKVDARIDGDEARARGIARHALRHFFDATDGFLPSGFSLRKDILAAAEAAGLADLPARLADDLEIVARGVDGLLDMCDALAAAADGVPVDEVRARAREALTRTGDATRIVEDPLDTAARRLVQAPSPSRARVQFAVTAPPPGAAPEAAPARHPDWDALAAPVADAATELASSGWRAGSVTLATITADFEVPALIREDCAIAVHPDLGSGGELVQWRLSQRAGGRGLNRNPDHWTGTPVGIRFFDAAPATAAASAIADRFGFDDAELGQRSHAERAQILEGVTTIVKPFQRQDRAAWREREMAAFSQTDATARGFDVDRPCYTYVENPGDPAIDPGRSSFVVLGQEDAAANEWGENYAPVYLRAGRSVDLAQSAWPEDVNEALRQFYDINRDVMMQNYAAWLVDMGEDSEVEIDRILAEFRYEDFAQFVRAGELAQVGSYSSSDIYTFLAETLHEVGYDVVWMPSNVFGETYAYVAHEHDLELAWDHLAERVAEAQAEAAAAEERQRDWYQSRSPEEVAQVRKSARRATVAFDLERLRAEGFDLETPAFVVVANRDLPILETPAAGALVAVTAHESRLGAAAEGRDVAPVYLRTHQRRRAELGSAAVAPEVAVALHDIYDDPDTGRWLAELGIASEDDFVGILRDLRNWRAVPGQANALMQHVAEGLLARAFDQVRVTGPDGRVQILLRDASDAVIARDALYRAQLSGRSADDIVGNPALSAAQRAARLAARETQALEGGAPGLLTHTGVMAWQPVSRADDIRRVAGAVVLFFRTAEGDFVAYDADADRAAGVESLRPHLSDIEAPGRDGAPATRTVDMTIPAAEMSAAMSALAAAGIDVAVADVGADGALELTTQGAGEAEAETVQYDRAALAAAGAAERDEMVQSEREAATWQALGPADRLEAVRGLVRRGEVVVLVAGDDLVLSGRSAERALEASATLAAAARRDGDVLRLAADRQAQMAAELADARLTLLVAEGPARASWRALAGDAATPPPGVRARAPAPAPPVSPIPASSADEVLRREVDRHAAAAARHGDDTRLIALPEGGRYWLYGAQAERLAALLPNDADLDEDHSRLADGTTIAAISLAEEDASLIAGRLEPLGVRLAAAGAGSIVADIEPLATTASVPFMITAKMRTQLAARGYTPDDVHTMTPAAAQRILSQPPAAAKPDTTPPAMPPEAAAASASAAPPSAAATPVAAVTPAPVAVAVTPAPAAPAPVPGRATPFPQGAETMSDHPVTFSAAPAAGGVESQLNDLLVRLDELDEEPRPEAVLRVLEALTVPAADSDQPAVPMLNQALYADVSGVAEHVYPLANGYVLFRDPDQGGRWTAYAGHAFLEALQPDGRLGNAAAYPPALADRLADYAGAYLPVMGELFDKELTEIREEVAYIAGAMNPHVRVEIAERLFGDGRTVLDSGAGTPSRQPAAGLYFRLHGAAAVSLDLSRSDPVETVYHEMFHSIAPLLNAEERAQLGRAFGLGREGGPPERLAEAFARYAAALWRGERPAIAAAAPPLTGFAKLLSFVARVNNVLVGLGWRTIEAVRVETLVERIALGEVAARATVFEIEAGSSAKEAARIANAAGAQRLAQTIEAYGSRLETGSDEVIANAALYRALRHAGGLDDRAIRRVLRDCGYQEIADPGRQTALLAEAESDRAAAMAQVTTLTPRTVSETLPPAMARLGARAALASAPSGGSGARPAGAATGAALAPWHLDQAAFLDRARTVKSASNGAPTDLSFDGVAGAALRYEGEKWDNKRWRFDHPQYPLTVDAKDAPDWRKAVQGVHYTLVRDALARGAFVPDRVRSDYPDLIEAYPARLIDDPRLVGRDPNTPVRRQVGPMIARMGSRRLGAPGSGARYSLGPDPEAARDRRAAQAAAFDRAALAAQGFEVGRVGWTAVADPMRPALEAGGTTVLDDEGAARRLVGDDIAPVYVARGRSADLAGAGEDPLLRATVAAFWRQHENLLRCYAAACAHDQAGEPAAAVAAGAGLTRAQFDRHLQAGTLGELIGDADADVIEGLGDSLAAGGVDSLSYRDAAAATDKLAVADSDRVAIAWDQVAPALERGRTGAAFSLEVAADDASPPALSAALAALAATPALDEAMRARRRSGLETAIAAGGLDDGDPAAGAAVYLGVPDADREMKTLVREVGGVEYDPVRKQYWIAADHPNSGPLAERFGIAETRPLARPGYDYLWVPAAERDTAVAAGARYDRHAGRFFAAGRESFGPWRGVAAAAAVAAERTATAANRDRGLLHGRETVARNRYAALDAAGLRQAWRESGRVLRASGRDLRKLAAGHGERPATERRLEEARETRVQIKAEAERRGVELQRRRPASRDRGAERG